MKIELKKIKIKDLEHQIWFSRCNFESFIKTEHYRSSDVEHQAVMSLASNLIFLGFDIHKFSEYGVPKQTHLSGELAKEYRLSKNQLIEIDFRIQQIVDKKQKEASNKLTYLSIRIGIYISILVLLLGYVF